jgi:hypothetical protein
MKQRHPLDPPALWKQLLVLLVPLLLIIALGSLEAKRYDDRPRFGTQACSDVQATYHDPLDSSSYPKDIEQVWKNAHALCR